MAQMRGSGEATGGRAHVVLMCGVAGSGKTTYAKRLEAQGYVRLSIDEELWSRFGRYGVDYDPNAYPRLSALAESTLRERLVSLIADSRDVVVDFSFWQRAARDEWKALVEDAGGRWSLVYLKVDPHELRRRLRKRTQRVDANAAFPITKDLLQAYLRSFEEPHGEDEQVVVLPAPLL